MKLSTILLNEGYLDNLAVKLSKKFPHLKFFVKFGERIDVRGSQQDMADFGNKHHGQVLGDYEVFHTDDDDQGEIVRIVKKDRL
tara:strand:- start:302 stop:553 length:252 start_codon:yes stop_codon:yes gene_type:complete